MTNAAFLVPYSTLLLQVLGALLVGVVLWSYGDMSLPIATVVAAIMLVLVLTVSALWQSAAQDGDAQRTSLAVPQGVAPQEKCLVDQDAEQLIAFAAWLRAHLPDHAIYAGVSDTCLAYQLLPRLPARPGERADWLVYPNGLPAEGRSLLERERILPEAERTVFMTAAGLGVQRLSGAGG